MSGPPRLLSPTPSTSVAVVRPPPSYLHAERGVLGTLMARPMLLDTVGLTLRPEHFADPLHGRLYCEIATQIVRRGNADAIILAEWFAEDPEGAKLGRKYLIDLITELDPLALPSYAQLVREAWTRRTIIGAARQAISDATNPAVQIDDGLTKLALAVDHALDGKSGSSGVSFKDASLAGLARVAAAIAANGPIGLDYGFPTLRRYCPMLAQRLTMIAGHNGMGKSALGHKMAVAVAKELRDEAERHGVVNPGYVLFISLEMEAADLALRADCIEAGVSFEAALAGFPESLEHEKVELFARLRRAHDELEKLPIHYEDCGGMTPSRISMKAKAMSRRLGKVVLVVIDYLQQVELESGSGGGGAFDMATMFKQIMKLKKDLNTHMLVLAQLGRKVAEREGHRPIQQDIGWGGAAEHIADTIILVDRPAYWLGKDMPARKLGISETDYEIALSIWEEELARVSNKAVFIVSKNRGGRADFDVPALFDGPTMNFQEDANEIAYRKGGGTAHG